jgi:hypothetical protein
MTFAEEVLSWPDRLDRFWAQQRERARRRFKRLRRSSVPRKQAADLAAPQAKALAARCTWLLALFLRLNGWRRAKGTPARWQGRIEAIDYRSSVENALMYTLCQGRAQKVRLANTPGETGKKEEAR